MQRSGVEEPNKLGDLATVVGTDKANAIESARTNWLSSLQSLASLKPSFTSPKTGQYGLTSEASGMSSAVSGLTSGIMDTYNSQNYLNELKKLSNTPDYGSTTQSSLTGLDTSWNTDWSNLA